LVRQRRHRYRDDRGVHTFTVIPKTAGNQSFGVSDRTNSNINGVVTVPIANYVPGLHFSVNASPTTDVAGAPFTVTVIALDTNNNVGVYYNGTVTFSAVAGSVLPADYTFTAADQGVHTFTNGATLFKAGNQTISTSPQQRPLDPDLARLVDAWPNLSATAKRMILAAVEADRPGA
jgi:hypothetical protein